MRRFASRAAGAVLAAVVALVFPHPVAAQEARSSDGRWILRADNAARELIALDAASGAIVKRIPVADKRGTTSRVSRLTDAPPRASFIALLADIPEAWELPYDPRAEPVFDGMVHDYRMGEGIAARGPLPVRRIVLDEVISDALFSPRFDFLVAAVPGGKLHVVNLHVRRRIETIGTGGAPRPERGAVSRDGTIYLIPDARAPRVLLLDANGWRLCPSIELPAAPTSVRIDGDHATVVTSEGELPVSVAGCNR